MRSILGNLILLSLDLWRALRFWWRFSWLIRERWNCHRKVLTTALSSSSSSSSGSSYLVVAVVVVVVVLVVLLVISYTCYADYHKNSKIFSNRKKTCYLQTLSCRRKLPFCWAERSPSKVSATRDSILRKADRICFVCRTIVYSQSYSGHGGGSSHFWKP